MVEQVLKRALFALPRARLNWLAQRYTDIAKPWSMSRGDLEAALAEIGADDINLRYDVASYIVNALGVSSGLPEISKNNRRKHNGNPDK